MDFGPHREKGGKMAEKWENWPKNGSKMAIFSPFFLEVSATNGNYRAKTSLQEEIEVE